MELAEEYRLSQYEDRGTLNGNERVSLVRNSITGKIAVKKCMDIGQKPVYDFLKNHHSRYTPEIYECVENAQQLIVIEQYIEGQNLEDFLSEGGITEKESCGVIYSLCRALEPLHTADPPVACRDLKPENIMVTPQNSVMLIDFDIARIVSSGRRRDTVLMGTEGYAAPEQFGRRQSDPRSDIYALGTVLNYCILQKFPVEKIADGKLGDIVRKCIAVNPEERYQSVAELRNEIKKLYPLVAEDIWKLESRQKCKETGKDSTEQKTDTKTGWRIFLEMGIQSGLFKRIAWLIMVFSASSTGMKINRKKTDKS